MDNLEIDGEKLDSLWDRLGDTWRNYHILATKLELYNILATKLQFYNCPCVELNSLY